jgi:hypothetical protein
LDIHPKSRMGYFSHILDNLEIALHPEINKTIYHN